MKNQPENKEKSAWPLLGNRHITEYLEKSIRNGRLASAYIFYGPDNLGKTTTARYFAKIILCQKRAAGTALPCGDCPSCRQFQKNQESEAEMARSDFFILKKDKDKKNISIENTRGFIRNLSLSALSGVAKVGIIKRADVLSDDASNALLKTLEEPKDKTVVILVANDLGALPGTIISRSQVFSFRPCAAEEIHDYLVQERGLPRSQAKNYSRLALGRPALAVKFFEDEEFRNFYKARMAAFVNFYRQDINRRLAGLDELTDKEEGIARSERTLEIWQGLLRDFFLSKNGLPELLQHEIIRGEIEKTASRLTAQKIIGDLKIIEAAKRQLRLNVKARTVLENVLINIC